MLAVAFGATLLTNRPGQSVNSLTNTVTAGGFRFHYPDSWGAIPSGQLPDSATSSASGNVVAGLCPGSRMGCSTSNVDVMYVLFEEGQGVAGTADLEQQLDASLPRSLAKFHKVGAMTRTSSDRTPFLRYEFTYSAGGVNRHEVIGAYRSGGGNNVLVVATGPSRAFGPQARQIDAMLLGARDDSAN